MKKNKQTLIIVLCLVLCIAFSACTSNERIPNSLAEEEYITFDQAIDMSYCIVIATLKEIKEYDTYREYLFSFEKSLKGEMDVDNFHVMEGYDEIHVDKIDKNYTTIEPKFSIGEKYILLLSKTTSVYFDHDKYMCLGDAFFEVDNNNKITKCRMYDDNVDIGIKDIDELKAYIDKATESGDKVEAYGIPFTKSNKLSEIVAVSQYIVKVRINRISIEAPSANRDTYDCSVLEDIKGSTDANIQVVLFKETVSLGEEYILLLNKETKDSLLYTLSSRNSVIPVNQTDQTKQLYDLLGSSAE